MKTVFSTVGIVGAGAMGRGIAQLAAQAGSTVLLFDSQSVVVPAALADVCAQWDRLREKGRMDQASVDACKARLRQAHALSDLASCELVVEAIEIGRAHV